ncbi:MAG: PBECR4 domain-containing protein [Lachnospiraceae bacterium]|nr:PBECR4 domain-containing protein [Lachnospiraceae bacterium]
MIKQKSFKERVKESVIQCAGAYKSYSVDYEYLICSSAFTKNCYYIISAHEDNYLHLTGVHTVLDAATFFEKCLEGTLQESDFDFCKSNQSERDVKGSVRRKINSLPSIMSMLSTDTFVEEDFSKNRIRCALAAGSVSATLGFVVVEKAKPMTLLKGNELDETKSEKIEIVLRRKAGDDKFTDIFSGDVSKLKERKEVLSDLLSDDLLSKISDSGDKIHDQDDNKNG